MIRLENVTKTYTLAQGRERAVLRNVSLTLERGEMMYLVGPTGCGKSTLLEMLYMDELPDEGIVQVGEYRSDNISRDEIPYLRRSLGVVFQDFQLLPDRDVYENVAFALYATGTRRKRIKQRVLHALSRVGLSHKRRQLPHELSGGEKQRVCIARAIVNDPWVVLADEPTGNLDPGVSEEILKLLVSLHHQGMTLLMATHDYPLVKNYPFRTFAFMKNTLMEVDPETL
jgi:cell division transport system ATP-binding protein